MRTSQKERKENARRFYDMYPPYWLSSKEGTYQHHIGAFLFYVTN